MIYLASPYSHPDPLIRKNRFLLARQACAHMMAKRLNVFSPIVHWHDIAELNVFPADAKFWQEYNTNMIRRADGICFLMITGWASSAGMKQEFQLAQELNLPMYVVTDLGDVFCASSTPLNYNEIVNLLPTKPIGFTTDSTAASPPKS